MDEYNFWKDLLDTFQSSTDWIKALWLAIPPLFLLMLIRMIMRYRLARNTPPEPVETPVFYQVHHNPKEDDWLQAELDRIEQDSASPQRRLT